MVVFKICFIFTPIIGEDSHGLKPPTRIGVLTHTDPGGFGPPLFAFFQVLPLGHCTDVGNMQSDQQCLGNDM